jgi:MYXO-CTERM domain-containing protein
VGGNVKQVTCDLAKSVTAPPHSSSASSSSSSSSSFLLLLLLLLVLLIVVRARLLQATHLHCHQQRANRRLYLLFTNRHD